MWQLTHDDDFLYVFTDFTIWSTVENGVGLAASSIATMRPLLKKVRDATTSSPGPFANRRRRRHDHSQLSTMTPQSSRPGSSARDRSWWDQFQYQDSPPLSPVSPTYSADRKSQAYSVHRGSRTYSADRKSRPDMAERLAIAPWEREEEPTDTGYSYRVTAHR